MMFLLGERAWKIPRWLDKILPSVDVEGENLNKQFGNAEVTTTTEVATEAK